MPRAHSLATAPSQATRFLREKRGIARVLRRMPLYEARMGRHKDS